MPPQQLTTQRLRLRQWQARDFTPFAQLNADPQVMAHCPQRLDRATSDRWAQREAALIAQRGWGLWAVELRDRQTFIGCVGLSHPAPALGFGDTVEMVWRLALPFWGHGYATEAAQACLTFGFAVLNLPEIIAFTALTNTRSQAVMARLGMQRDPAPFVHPALPPGHPLAVHYLYHLAREGWPRAK